MDKNHLKAIHCPWNARIMLALCCLMALTASRPAVAQYAGTPLTQLVMQSEPGDYIGQGQNYLFNANDGTFNATVNVNSAGRVDTVTINFQQGSGGERWYLVFSSSQLGTELIPGTYNNAERFPAGAGHPGLDVNGDSRGSNTLIGKFNVSEAVYDYSSTQPRLVSFAASFEQHSEGNSPALSGTIYINSYHHPQIPDTSHPTTNSRIAGNIGKMGRYTGPVHVMLSATDPDGPADVTRTYYTVDGGASQSYASPFTVTGDAFHAISYWSVDNAGNAEAMRTQGLYIDSTGPTNDPPLTQLAMSSQPGDYIGQGQDYLYTTASGLFTSQAYAHNPAGRFDYVIINYNSTGSSDSHFWATTFATDNLGLPLAPGIYDRAQREAAASLGYAGMDVYGDGRGSNMLTGKFTVLDATFDYTGSAPLQSFAAIFEQHSEGAAPALTGTIYYHSQAYVHLTAQPLSSLQLGPVSADRSSVTGLVTLQQPADRGGQFVTLSTSDPLYVTLPATVFVASGMTSAAFTASLRPVMFTHPVTISADGDGVVRVETLMLQAPIWRARAIAVSADGNTRLLWDRNDGLTALWTVNPAGAIVNAPQYGHFSEWIATTLSAGADGNTRLLWNKNDGTAALWTVNPAGMIIGAPQYGSFAGWTAVAISTGSDGNTRLLWNRNDGTVALWTVNPVGEIVNAPQFGPFAGWTATALSAEPDGNTRLLWNKNDGTVALWTVNPAGAIVNAPQYGPFSGWTATALSVGSDGNPHLLWNNANGTVALWTLNTAGAIVAAPQFGPYPGWAATGLSVGPDGNVHMLWDKTDGTAALWTVASTGAIINAPQFGPY